MPSQDEWQKTEGGFECGSARAQRFPGVKAFVITTFGDDATAETALDCIVAAARLGQPTAIRADESNRALGRELHQRGLVRFCPFAGLPFEAFGVAAIQADCLRAQT